MSITTTMGEIREHTTWYDEFGMSDDCPVAVRLDGSVDDGADGEILHSEDVDAEWIEWLRATVDTYAATVDSVIARIVRECAKDAVSQGLTDEHFDGEWSLADGDAEALTDELERDLTPSEWAMAKRLFEQRARELLEPKHDQCQYCGVDVPSDEEVPDEDDDEAWAAEAKKHASWCEWVTSRAHRRQ